MTTTELCYCDIWELGGLMRLKQRSPSEVVEATLSRVERINPLLNAFITVTAEEARLAAKQAEKEIIQGRYRGPLHGVPISLKDLYATRGVRTTAGSRILGNWIPEQDATAVVRLREAGAIVIGKTNLDEFALGSTTMNPHYGCTHNPWDQSRIACGSSGGSAAAVAAGLSYAALGSETGGSIRRPASVCGVVGLKPTYGRISRHGMVPAAWSLDHAGFFVRSVRDAALLLNVLAGPDPLDPSCSNQTPVDYAAQLGRPITGMRVGVPIAYVSEDVDPQVKDAFWNALNELGRLGAQVVHLGLPSIRFAAAVSSAIMGAEAASYHQRWLSTCSNEYGEPALGFLSWGMCVTGSEYLKAQRARRMIKREVLGTLATVDALVAPTTGTPATLISDGSAGLSDRPFDVGVQPQVINRLISLLGVPAISVVCGFTTSGLPISLQLAARPFEEQKLLQIASAYEAETRWGVRRPPLP